MHISLSYLIWNWNDKYVHTLQWFPRKPYPIPDQFGQSVHPFSNKNDAKTLPDGAAHTKIAHIREYPPGWKLCAEHKNFVNQSWFDHLDLGNINTLWHENEAACCTRIQSTLKRLTFVQMNRWLIKLITYRPWRNCLKIPRFSGHVTIENEVVAIQHLDKFNGRVKKETTLPIQQFAPIDTAATEI